VNSLTGLVLQQTAKPTYRVPASAAGAKVFCQVLAKNEGGTAVLETDPTQEIGPMPKIGIGHVTPIAAVRGHTANARVILYVPSGVSGKFGVCVTPPASVAGRACSSFRSEDGSYGAFRFVLRLRIKPTAPLGAARLGISAVAGIASVEAAALLRVARAAPG
jgi:hypothetical protein